MKKIMNKTKASLAMLLALLLLCSMIPVGGLMVGAAEIGDIVFSEDFEDITPGTTGNWETSDGNTTVVKGSVGKDFSQGAAVNGIKWSRFYRIFNLEPNSYYEVSFDYYESTTTEAARLSVRDSDSSVELYCSDPLENTKGQWEHYSAVFNSEDLTEVRVILSLDKDTENSDKAFDNIIFRKVEEPSAAGEVVFSDDFEAAAAGTVGSWENAQSITSVVKEGAGKDFSKGLVVNGPKWSRTRIALTLEAYTTYEISYDYYESTTTQNSRVTVRAKDSNPILDAYASDFQGNTKGQWEHYTGTFYTSDITVWWLMVQLEEVTTGSDKTYDNFVIRKVEDPGDLPEEEKLVFTNGDFETGDFTGWEGQKNSTIITENVHRGSYAAKVTEGQWGGVAQWVDVVPGTDYRFSFWARYESGSGEQTLYVMNETTTINMYTYSVRPSKADGWVQYEYIINTGTQKKILLKFGISNPNAVFVYDDVTFAPLGEVTHDGYLYNGDFETGDKSKWEGGGDFDMVTDAHEGSYAVHVKGDNWATMAQMITTKADTEYSVILWAKKASGNGKFAVIYKDNRQTKHVAELYIDTTDEWARYTWTFNTGEYANGYLVIMADSSANTAYLDAITVMEGKPVSTNGLIINGDFETGDLTGWENIHSDSEVVQAESPCEGEYVLSLKGGQWTSVRQTVKTAKNTEYRLTFYVKRVAGMDDVAVWLKNGDDNLLDPDGKEIGGEFSVTESDGWLKVEHVFNSFGRTTVDVLFGLMNNGNEYLIDGIHLDKNEKPVVAPLKLYSFGQVTNRPKTAEANLIVNGGFESAEGAQWNTYTFTDDNLSVIEDETAKEGNKVLYFNSSAVAENKMHVFWVNVEPNTNYTFSAFVKGAYLSKDNICTATFGVLDPDTETFLIYSEERGKNSKDYYQLVPPCWDNEWHLRSVAFNSGEKTKIGIAVYGASSQMYLDDIALYKSDSGEKYSELIMTDMVTTNIQSQHAGCDPEDNLVGNFNLNDAENTFWSTGYGWKNGTLGIYEDEYGYGNSLQYTAGDNPVGVHYIKWIDVEPQTLYTFSIDLLVQESGGGYLALIDSKPSKPAMFVMLNFDKEVFGEEWTKFYLDFNTGCYERIGIAVVDKGGQALMDNIRLFKAADGKDVTDDFVAAKSGWEQAGSKWIYFEDGEQVYGKWIKDGGAWYYIGADGYMVANKWMKDSKGWCWLTASGKMATNAWVKDSKGWCYVGADGYCVTNTWKKDSVGWCYLDENGSMVKNDWVVDDTGWYLLDANGYMMSKVWIHDGFGWVYLEPSGKLATNKWVKDSVGWCYVDENGYCVTNVWKKDSNGWCYLDQSGHMATNKWVKDSQGWCYVGSDGYCVTNTWKKDSVGWCYLGADGRMVTNKWVKDSVGWCYVGSDGYAVTNTWKQDSVGWCYLNDSGSMTKNGWVNTNGKWYYLDGNGYMVTNKTLTIGGVKYNFNASGVCTNP